MSFQIFVIIPQTDIPMPANPHDWEKWARECSKLILLEEILGTDATVYRFWSGPAEQLRLPLLASLYQHGLHFEASHGSGRDSVQPFEDLLAELDALESYWQTHLVDSAPASSEGSVGEASILEALEERLRHFRRAIRLALEKQAILFVEQPS